jgi:TPR repeat protein
MYRLARIYHLGRGVVCDYQKAYNLYTRAAELGHSDSSRLLDITNYSINQHSEDLKDSLSIIKFMARKGNINLQYILGIFYITNKDRLNYNEAFKWFQMAASNKNTNAIYQLGLLYENGQGTIQDYSTAYRLYSRTKEKGHPESIYRLGIAYQYGLGVEINTSEAIDCYSKAAELENNESQFKLGKLYGSGELLGKDSLKSLKWYTKAYLNGNYGVINDLYQLYDGVPLESFFYKRLFRILSDIENSYKLDNRQSHRHYGSLYVKLGTMYLNGQGTTKNHSVALKHFLTAYYDYNYGDAEPFLSLKYNQYEVLSQSIYLAKLEAYLEIQDQIPSEHQYQLGMLYYDGVEGLAYNPSTYSELTTVLATDYFMAFRYFKLASLKNHGGAQDQLGLMYLRGHGVKKDYQEALEWFNMASKSMEDYPSYKRGKDFYYGNTVDEDHKIGAIYFQNTFESDEYKAQTYLDSVYLRKIEIKQQESETMDQFDNKVEDIAPSSLYYRGVEIYEQSSGVIENYNLSLFYIRKAAKKNYSQAFVQLGIMYLEGRVTEKDVNEAIRWIEKSIEVMDPRECYEQGMYFYNDRSYRISLRYMKKAAEGNNGDAQAYLSLMYFGGLGVEKSHKQAMKWFQKSTIQFNNYALYKKGMEFYESADLDNNYKAALLYLKKAADGDYGSAQVQLGIMYLQGVGVEKNYKIAMEWIESSLEEMYKFECFTYGMLFYNGIEVGKNYDIALVFLKKAADDTHRFALATLGLMYLDGHGISENEYEAMRLIEKSLKNMEPNECYTVGIHLYNQYESEKHLGIAWIFINKAAKEGYGLTQALLGEMYLEGKGVRKNQDEALEWITISAGNLKSHECYDQAMKYYNGFDIEKNYNVAMLYLQAANPKKYTLAQVQIGIMYLEGHGVEKSEVKAMEYFQQSMNDMDLKDCYSQGISFYNEHRYAISLLYIRRAAEAGYGPAQSQLGIMLLGGKAIQKNQTDAMFWIEKSIELMTPFDCYNQGIVLYRGLSVVKDFAISLRFMEKAAENHYGPAQAQAQAHLALVYYQGFGVKKNRNEAMKWVERSLKYLSPDECYEHGIKFHNGTEVDPDYEITLLYIQKAIERHHGPSQAQLALMYLEGSGVVKNYGSAMYWIEKSINEMKLAECYRQGMLFYHRRRLENNYDIALRYFKKASKANAYAQAQLGYMYLNGIGVDQDHEEAARWHGMAENNYIGHSKYCRSKIYHYDQGGMQDFSKALKLYQEELEAIDFKNKLPNNSGALRGIGLLYEYGDGATQDFKKALKYYGNSASHKNIAAYYNIGLLYYYGKGVDLNHKAALFWFTKVTGANIDPQQLHVFVEDNGNDAKGVTGFLMRTYSLQPESRIYGEAHYYIGVMYNNGLFVDQDEEGAQNYFKMAHVHGVERAKKLLLQ